MIKFIRLIQEEIDTSPKKIRDFGWVMFVMLGLIIPFIISWINGWIITEWMQGLFATGLILLVLSLFIQPLAKPIYRGWMTIALLLGLFMTKVIITLIYYLMMTPIGIGRQIFARDPLNMKIDPDKESYWVEKTEKTTPASYEKQY